MFMPVTVATPVSLAIKNGENFKQQLKVQKPAEIRRTSENGTCDEKEKKSFHAAAAK